MSDRNIELINALSKIRDKSQKKYNNNPEIGFSFDYDAEKRSWYAIFYADDDQNRCGGYNIANPDFDFNDVLNSFINQIILIGEEDER